MLLGIVVFGAVFLVGLALFGLAALRGFALAVLAGTVLERPRRIFEVAARGRGDRERGGGGGEVHGH